MCALFLRLYSSALSDAAPIHLDTFLGQYPSRRELTAISFILASFFTSRPAPPPPRHPANSLTYLEGCRSEAHLETSWGAMRCHRALAKSHVLPTHYELEICLTPPECPLIQTSPPPPLPRTPMPTSRASHRPSRRPSRAPQARAPAALRGSSMQWRTSACGRLWPERARLYAVLPACGGQGVGLQRWCGVRRSMCVRLHSVLLPLPTGTLVAVPTYTSSSRTSRSRPSSSTAARSRLCVRLPHARRDGVCAASDGLQACEGRIGRTGTDLNDPTPSSAPRAPRPNSSGNRVGVHSCLWTPLEPLLKEVEFVHPAAGCVPLHHLPRRCHAHPYLRTHTFEFPS
ncbi:hypothetical protein C8J57DRAFT_356823 [Mycena rebaudengoi]|nr:hypothetical protein C8J57DRAFT_356823 [Mycena rebaudengoi]